MRFYVEGESLNYLSHSYDGQSYNANSSYFAATPVFVTAGSTTSAINAEMLPGGQIAGRVIGSGGAPLAGVSVCARPTSEEFEGGDRCATTNGGGGSASAVSDALAVPAASTTSAPSAVLALDSDFSLVRAPVFDARTGDLDFYVNVANAGTLRWRLSLKGSDLVATGGARASRRARRHATMPFSSASRHVPAGVVEVELHAGAVALRTLRAGRALHVSGPFAFQSVLGGAPVVHMESVVVRWPKKQKHGGKK